MEKGDILYLFSDGFKDQIGGKEGKKLKSGKFKKLLYKIHKAPLEKQKILLEEFYKKWAKDYHQLDDICILGAKK